MENSRRVNGWTSRRGIARTDEMVQFLTNNVVIARVARPKQSLTDNAVIVETLCIASLQRTGKENNCQLSVVLSSFRPFALSPIIHCQLIRGAELSLNNGRNYFPRKATRVEGIINYLIIK
jgi:hypothetical protein